MNIVGKKVILRAIEEDDLELLRDMVNDSEIENLVVGWSIPVSKQAQKNWFDRSKNDHNNIRVIIEDKENGSVGMANIVNIDWKNRVAFHGIKISSKASRGKGIGTDAVMAIMRYAFDELQLNRLDGAIIDYNIPSKKLYSKCGWKDEGVKRKYIYKNGKYHDLIILGILKEEYYELVRQTNYWSE